MKRFSADIGFEFIVSKRRDKDILSLQWAWRCDSACKFKRRDNQAI